jgi:hypothetical protein
MRRIGLLAALGLVGCTAVPPPTYAVPAGRETEARRVIEICNARGREAASQQAPLACWNAYSRTGVMPAAASAGSTVATGISAPRQNPSAWASRCAPDRFADRVTCSLTISLPEGTSTLTSSLSSSDFGRTWSIVADRRLMTYRLRVDQHPAISGTCSGALGTCTIASGANFTRQLQAGRMLAVQLTANLALSDGDISIAGFQAALDEARSQAARQSAR